MAQNLILHAVSISGMPNKTHTHTHTHTTLQLALCTCKLKLHAEDNYMSLQIVCKGLSDMANYPLEGAVLATANN